MPASPAGHQALHHVRVGDCMRKGILTCDRDAPLGEIAGIMARHRVHSVVIAGEHSTRPERIISDLDVAAAMTGAEGVVAAQTAVTESLRVSSDDSLHHAAQMMVEHGVSHLIVVDAAGGYPVGMLSTLDIASAYAGLTTERQR